MFKHETNLQVALMACAMAAQTVEPYTVRHRKKPVKQCLICFTSHTHNNAFCSSECCSDYKDMINV